MFWKKNKDKQNTLEQWELYPQYIAAVKAVEEFEGPKWTKKTTTTKKKDETSETEEEVMTIEYATVIAERDKMLEAAEAYRANKVAEVEANKKESLAPAVVKGLIGGLFSIGGVILSIGGKKWLEDRDSFDEGGVLTDVQKDSLKSMRPKNN